MLNSKYIMWVFYYRPTDIYIYIYCCLPIHICEMKWSSSEDWIGKNLQSMSNYWNVVEIVWFYSLWYWLDWTGITEVVKLTFFINRLNFILWITLLLHSKPMIFMLIIYGNSLSNGIVQQTHTYYPQIIKNINKNWTEFGSL